MIFNIKGNLYLCRFRQGLGIYTILNVLRNFTNNSAGWGLDIGCEYNTRNNNMH